jgi:hypothetical protein
VEGGREEQFVHCIVHHNEEFRGPLLEYEEYQMARIVIVDFNQLLQMKKL